MPIPSESEAGHRKSLSIDTNAKRTDDQGPLSQEDSIDSSIPSSIAGFEYKGLNRLSVLPEPRVAGYAQEPEHSVTEEVTPGDAKKSGQRDDSESESYESHFRNSYRSNYSSDLTHADDTEDHTDTESRAESTAMYNYDTYDRALATQIDEPIQHNIENLSLSRPLDSSESSSEASSFVERTESTRSADPYDKRASYASSTRIPFESYTSAENSSGLTHSAGLLSIHERTASTQTNKSESELLTERLLESLTADQALSSHARETDGDTISQLAPTQPTYEDDLSSSARTAGQSTTGVSLEDEGGSLHSESQLPSATTIDSPFDQTRGLYDSPYESPYGKKSESAAEPNQNFNPYDPATRPPIPETHPVIIQDNDEGEKSVHPVGTDDEVATESEYDAQSQASDDERSEDASGVESDSNSVTFSDAQSFPQKSENDNEQSQGADYELITSAALIPPFNFEACMKEKNPRKRRELFETARNNEREFNSGIQQWLIYMKEQRQEGESFYRSLMTCTNL